jgi:protein-S-isoprenylcysteine O-methyltransferase Ste14
MDSGAVNPAQRKIKLDRCGVRGIVTGFVGILIALAVLLVSSGKNNWMNGWLFFGLILGYEIAYVGLFLKANPGLLNERGKVLPKGSKSFDKVFAALYLPLYFSILIVSGIDVGRYDWTVMPSVVVILGVILFLIASSLSFWAMWVNPFFECTVLIQKQKEQKVVIEGPYKIVRHPGYIAGIVSILSVPLILGSLWGLVPSIMLIITLVFRTALEDLTLQRELPGYKEYMKVTRYRLLPFLW